MEYLTVAYQALFSIITLFIITKVLGYRQLSQFSMFDYINSITIGSVAAQATTDLEGNYLKFFPAMIIYALFVILLSKLSEKSIPLRRLINGTAIVLYLHGEIFNENLKKANMDVDEFLAECRIGGYFDLTQVEAVILEPNGQISFLPVTENRPATPKDLGISTKQEQIFSNIIVDGQILEHNLKHIGKDRKWLNQQLVIQNVKDIKDVFLAICDQQGNFHVYEKFSHIVDHDILG